MYRFKLSVARYELMILDVARVVYDKDKKENGRVEADAESIRLNEESLRKAKERHEWKETTLSELDNTAP